MTISTNRGDIKVSLDKDKAPCTVNSFVSLAKQGYFDNTHCHRLTVTGIFVLQCGDPRATGKVDDPNASAGGPGYYVKDELVDNDPRLQPCFNQTDPRSGKQLCTYTDRHGGDGQRRPGHRRLAVLPRLQGLPAVQRLHRLRADERGRLKVVQSIAAGGAYPPDSTGEHPARGSRP